MSNHNVGPDSASNRFASNQAASNQAAPGRETPGSVADATGAARPPTYYDRLGVEPSVTPQRLRQAHRDLSKLYHPDTTRFPAEEARLRFEQVQTAYEVLSDRAQRLQYDLEVGVITPPKSIAPPAADPPAPPEISSSIYLSAEDRPLSSGELFALFILAVTFLGCLVIALGLGIARGDAWMTTPSWQTGLPPAGWINVLGIALGIIGLR